MVSVKEKKYLQDLAKRYRTIADSDKNQKKKQLWYDINDLKVGARPVFMNHYWPIALEELFPEDTYICESEEGRYYEIYLKTRLLYAEDLDDDNVIEPVIYSQTVLYCEDYEGFGAKVRRSDDDDAGAGAYEMVTVLTEEKDLDKLRPPVVRFDKEKSYQNYLSACDIFEPILTVIKEPYTRAAKIADEYSWLRGMENTYMDMYDKPEMMHDALNRIKDNFTERFHQLEEQGVWGTLDMSNPLGSAGLRYISGQKDFRDVENPFDYKVPLADSWGFTCAEVFNCVSNQMHDDFSFAYDKEVMSLFSHINVGCCEVLDKKIELCRQLPNTRKVSVSEWCDHSLAAASIKRDYVYSYRAAGVHFVGDVWKKADAEKEIRSVLEASKASGCNTEIVLNIGGTLGNYPKKKVTEWSKLVRDLIDEYYPA